MQYHKNISYSTKIAFLLKRIFNFLLKKQTPYRILSFSTILNLKEPAINDGIINYPEHFNWKVAVVNNDPAFLAYTPVLNNEKFDYQNKQFLPHQFGNKHRFKNRGIFPVEPKYVYSLENANVMGPYGVVFDPCTRALVKETVLHYFLPSKNNQYLNAVHSPNQVIITGSGVLLAHPGSDAGFYHFVMESLSKMVFIESISNSIDHFFIPGPSTPWKTKWLNFFGLDEKKIIWLDYHTNINVNQLLFTSPVITDYQPENALVSYIRKLANDLLAKSKVSSKTYPKKIWLTRGGHDRRNIEWENLIIKDTGITPINFNELDLVETILICRNADLIIGPHGAAFLHLLFCDTTKVVELFPDNQMQPIYSRLSQCLGLVYTALTIDFVNAENNNSFNTIKQLILAS